MPDKTSDDAAGGAHRRSVVLTFSAPPKPLDIIQARNALRITPPVDDLSVTGGGKRRLLIRNGVRVAGRCLGRSRPA
jgi:hypothetical protein